MWKVLEPLCAGLIIVGCIGFIAGSFIGSLVLFDHGYYVWGTIVVLPDALLIIWLIGVGVLDA